MNWTELLDRFDLTYYRVLHEQIETITAIQSHIFVKHSQRDLLVDPQSAVAQLENQASLIGRFKQSRPNRLMYLDHSPNDLPCDLVEPVLFFHSRRPRR